MKKIVLGVILCVAVMKMAGCTNHEGSQDIDIITPADSIQGVDKQQDIDAADL